MVAVPEFSAGAMENFGLIVYRESHMLYSDLKSTARRKQIVSWLLKRVSDFFVFPSHFFLVTITLPISAKFPEA